MEVNQSHLDDQATVDPDDQIINTTKDDLNDEASAKNGTLQSSDDMGQTNAIMASPAVPSHF